MNKKQKSLNNKGFSLVELIIVIAIMAVLIGVLAPQYLGYVKNSKIYTDLQNAESLATQIAVVAADAEAGTTAVTLSSSYAAVTDVTGLVEPSVKATTGGHFYYKYANNTVYISISTAVPTDDTKQVYPTVENTDYQ